MGLGSAPRGAARDHEECPDQNQDLDHPLHRGGHVSSRSGAEYHCDEERGSKTGQDESAEEWTPSHAKRPRGLGRLGATERKTPDESNDAAAQRCPPGGAITGFLTPLVPGSIGGGAKSAAASMPGIGKPASVLVETCLHL